MPCADVCRTRTTGTTPNIFRSRQRVRLERHKGDIKAEKLSFTDWQEKKNYPWNLIGIIQRRHHGGGGEEIGHVSETSVRILRDLS